MKKLLIFIPVVLWISCYFVWTYSAPLLVTPPTTPGGIWWLLTDLFITGATIFSVPIVGASLIGS